MAYLSGRGDAGVPTKKIRTLGFPVSIVFGEEVKEELPVPTKGVERRILYIINTGKALNWMVLAVGGAIAWMAYWVAV